MSADPIQRVRDFFDEPMHRTSSSLIASNLLTGALGFLFWAIVARTCTPEEVGRASALIVASVAVSRICLLNLDNVVVRFLPQLNSSIGTRIIQSYATTFSVSAVGALLFVLLIPIASHEFDFLREGWLLSASFVIFTALWSLFVLEDAVLVALDRVVWVPIENGLFGVAKILLLVLTGVVAASTGVFLAWMLPILVIVPVIGVLINRRVLPAATEAQKNAAGVVSAFGWKGLTAYLLQDFFGSLSGHIMTMSLPVLVVALLGSADAAYFYVPFTLVIAFDGLLYAVSSSLTVEAARDIPRVQPLTRLAVRRMLTVLVPGAAAIFLAAPLLLYPFGSEYVDNGTTVLRLLALGSVFHATIALFGAAARLRGAGARLITAGVLNLVLLITLLIPLSERYGVDGVGWSWAIASGITAVWVLPYVISFVRHPSVRAGAPGDPVTP
ncbi:MAG: lipopolysaccharide biosynthesis protein [Solirubrobacterales bacterium]